MPNKKTAPNTRGRKLKLYGTEFGSWTASSVVNSVRLLRVHGRIRTAAAPTIVTLLSFSTRLTTQHDLFSKTPLQLVHDILN